MNGQKIPGKVMLIGIAGVVIFMLILATYFGVDAGDRAEGLLDVVGDRLDRLVACGCGGLRRGDRSGAPSG